MSVDPVTSIELLRRLGIRARIVGPRAIAVGAVAGGERSYRLVSTDASPPPSVVLRELRRARLEGLDGLCCVVRSITSSLHDAAVLDGDIVVLAPEQGIAIVDGSERSLGGRQVPELRTRRGRPPHGRLALLRVLLRTDEPRTQTALAKESGVTQQAVARSLARLVDDGLVAIERKRWVPRDARAIWDVHMDDYTGPGGVRQRWYGVAQLSEQVGRAARSANDATILRSGDLAADEIAPWRRPRVAVVYARRGLDLEGSLAPVPEDRPATLEVVLPTDATTFATGAAWYPGRRLTDPLITAWELRRGGGPDAVDAIDHLRDRTLSGLASRD